MSLLRDHYNLLYSFGSRRDTVLGSESSKWILKGLVMDRESMVSLEEVRPAQTVRKLLILLCFTPVYSPKMKSIALWNLPLARRFIHVLFYSARTIQTLCWKQLEKSYLIVTMWTSTLGVLSVSQNGEIMELSSWIISLLSSLW